MYSKCRAINHPEYLEVPLHELGQQSPQHYQCPWPMGGLPKSSGHPEPWWLSWLYAHSGGCGAGIEDPALFPSERRKDAHTVG